MRGREEDKETIENNSNFPLLSKNPDEDRENDGIYMKPKQLFTKNPLENTNIISKLFFSWVTPLTWVNTNKLWVCWSIKNYENNYLFIKIDKMQK